MNYKKYFTVDDLVAAAIAGLGYGLGYGIPTAYGCPMIVSMVICMISGIAVEEAAKALLRNPVMQKDQKNKILLIAGMFVVYGLIALYSSKTFHVDLGDTLIKQLGYAFAFSFLGFVVGYLRKRIAEERLQKKYAGNTVFNAADAQAAEAVSDLKGVDGPVTDPYEQMPYIRAENGIFVGKKQKGIECFAGVPYAKPPVGALRWKKTEKAPASDRVQEAFYFDTAPLYSMTPALLPQARTGEDCLKLNLWRPAKRKGRLPVFVYLPDTLSMQGTADNAMALGDTFCKNAKDVIFVSINYRAGMMGFTDFSGVPGGEAFPDAGRLGILDVICALEWIRDNAKAIGAADGNVTLFGSRGSGAVVNFLTVMPEAKGLFQKAVILDSDIGCLSVPEDQRQGAADLLKAAGKTDMAGLMELSEEELRSALSAFAYVEGPGIGVISPWTGVAEAYEAGAAAGISLMAGLSEDVFGVYRGVYGKETGSMVDAAFEYYVQHARGEVMEREAQRNEQGGMKRETARIRAMEDTYFYDPVTEMCCSLQRGGGKVRLFYWDYAPAVKKFGSNTITFLAQLSGKTAAGTAAGCFVDEKCVQLIHRLLANFCRTGDPSLEHGDIPSGEALRWEAFGERDASVLVIGDTFCTVERNPLFYRALQIR